MNALNTLGGGGSFYEKQPKVQSDGCARPATVLLTNRSLIDGTIYILSVRFGNIVV